ncbi:MAG TPA: sirohydrochlorin chelatase [Gammaproteobacteria bacterium]|nr:sirohydrochlorin chelatase [Gammaproteobacteria bacterium]
MSDTVLLVGHGSRHPAGNIEIEQFAKEWRKRNPDWDIEVCYIEFADVLLDAGFDHAARKSSKVIVVPLILNAAAHVKMEVPAHLTEARKRHPKVEFIYAPHLGAGEPVLKILKRELRQGMAQLDMPDPKTTGIILLGRGSSDRVANGEVAKMARWLWEDHDHELIDIAFTGITYPRLETVVQRQVKLAMTQIVIQPYYLFDGTLIERIKRQHQNLVQQYPQVRFALGNYFGFADEIYQTLDQRVADARGENDGENGMMECDGCQYRELAEEQGLGHHHDHDHAHEH